jgi:hypothetical protein
MEVLSMSAIPMSSFLRTALLVDAIATAATGALLALGGPYLDEWLGLPSALLVSVGLPLLPFAALVAWLATRDTAARNAIRFVMVSNALWVAASVALLLSHAFAPTLLGVAFVLAQAAAVAAFAEFQLVGLRRVSA